MFRNYIAFFLAFLLITSCGYSPIYSKKNNNALNIVVTNYEGDTQINSLIKSRLKFHQSDTAKLHEITVKTEYKKTDLIKNNSGKITKYKLDVICSFEIKINEITKTIVITESFNMDNFTDDFEEKNYEKKIKENIAYSIYENLIERLLKTDDL